MNREDVISMALEAGFTWEPINNIVGPLERFAALVAAAERAACAEHYLAVMRKAIEEEREACAKLCETQQSNWNYCAAAIRARSST